MSRSKDGEETKVARSVRVEPSILAKIKKKYGGLSQFLNTMIKKEGIKRDKKK